MLSQVTRTVAVLTHMGRPAAIDAATRLVEGLSAAGVVAALPDADLGQLDPRLAHAVRPLPKPVNEAHGIELMVVPLALRQDLEQFVRAQGRVIGQPAGVGAPPSIVDQIRKGQGG